MIYELLYSTLFSQTKKPLIETSDFLQKEQRYKNKSTYTLI